MKKHFYSILLIFLCTTTFAQATGETYIIQFKDKGNASFSTAVPDKYMSPRAIERRIIQQVPIDQTDLPVHGEYLDAIKSTGARVIYTSKWLNVAIAEIDDDEQVSKISTLPFIKNIRHSEVFKTRRTSWLFKKNQEEKYQEVKDKFKSGYKSVDYVFDYGVSGNQARMIKVDQLHLNGFTGKDVMIAVMDAGFNSVDQMSAFDTLRARGLILGVRDFVQPGNNLYGSNMSSHGTMVLSTMGGNIPGQIVGTAPHASYYLVRTEDAAAEYLMEEFFWVAAAEYADSLGVDIINSSLGYTTFDDPREDHTYNDLNGDTSPITIAADLAAKKGILVINSAGNQGSDPWRYISMPADGDSVMAVGAVNSTGTIVSFSSVGPTADGRIKPDVVTQGFEVVVAVGGNGILYANGTSFASPILTGAAACLWQANPTLSNMDIFNAIKQSGSTSSNPNNSIGWGIPDFTKALGLIMGNDENDLAGNNMFCYPNPFISYIKTSVNISDPNKSSFRLINTHGKVVRQISTMNLVKGINEITIDGLGTLPRGIYFLQYSNGSSTVSQKLLK